MRTTLCLLTALLLCASAQAQYIPGGPISVQIPVTNAGPDGPADATVAVTFPPEMTLVTWTCSALPPAGCTGGSGDILDMAVIPNGVTITYDVDAVIAIGASGNILIGYDVTLTTPVAIDPDLGNNSTTTSTTITIPPVMDLQMGTPIITAAASASMHYFDLWTNDSVNAQLGICDIDACPEDQRASIVQRVNESCKAPGNTIGDTGLASSCKIALMAESCTMCAGGGQGGAFPFQYSRINVCDPVYVNGAICPNGGSLEFGT